MPVLSALSKDMCSITTDRTTFGGGEMLLILDFIVWQTETCVVVRVQRELFSERFLWTTSESKDQHWMELVFCGYKPYPQPHDLGQ